MEAHSTKMDMHIFLIFYAQLWKHSWQNGEFQVSNKCEIINNQQHSQADCYRLKEMQNNK